MESLFFVGINKVLCAGYFLLIAWMNCTMYLIAAFYRKRFNQYAPRYGFIFSVAFAVLFVASLFFTDTSPAFQGSAFHLMRTSLLVGSALTSGWSSVNLLIIMKKSRK